MAKAIRSRGAVYYEDLKNLRKGLRALETDGPWKADLKEAGRKAAEVVAAEARSRIKPGANEPRKGQRHWRDLIEAKGLATGGKITFGGPKAPHSYAQGEFGGTIPKRNRSGRIQFKPWKRSGYFIFPSLKDKRAEVGELYRKGVDEIVNKYFPGG